MQTTIKPTLRPTLAHLPLENLLNYGEKTTGRYREDESLTFISQIIDRLVSANTKHVPNIPITQSHTLFQSRTDHLFSIDSSASSNLSEEKLDTENMSPLRL